MYRKNFSERIKSLRKENGKSQEDIANMLNISYAAVSMMETNKRSPSFEVLCSLADFFDVSIDYLVGRSDDPTRH